MIQEITYEQQPSSLHSFVNSKFSLNATSSQICQNLDGFIKEYREFLKQLKVAKRSGERQERVSIENKSEVIYESGMVSGKCHQILKFLCQLLAMLGIDQEDRIEIQQVSNEQKQDIKSSISTLLQKIRFELQIQAIENNKQNQGDIYKQIISQIIKSSHKNSKIMEQVLLENYYLTQQEYLEIAEKCGIKKNGKKQEKKGQNEQNEMNKIINENKKSMEIINKNLCIDGTRSSFLINYIKQRNNGKNDQFQKNETKQEPNFMMPLKQKQIQKSRTVYHSRTSVHMTKKSNSSRGYFSSYGNFNSFEKLESFDNSTQWSSTQNSQNYDLSHNKLKNESYFKSKSAKNFSEIQMEIQNRQREEDESFLVAQTPKIPSFNKKGAYIQRRINFVLQF